MHLELALTLRVRGRPGKSAAYPLSRSDLAMFRAPISTYRPDFDYDRTERNFVSAVLDQF